MSKKNPSMNYKPYSGKKTVKMRNGKLGKESFEHLVNKAKVDADRELKEEDFNLNAQAGSFNRSAKDIYKSEMKEHFGENYKDLPKTSNIPTEIAGEQKLNTNVAGGVAGNYSVQHKNKKDKIAYKKALDEQKPYFRKVNDLEIKRKEAIKDTKALLRSEQKKLTVINRKLRDDRIDGKPFVSLMKDYRNVKTDIDSTRSQLKRLQEAKKSPLYKEAQRQEKM